MLPWRNIDTPIVVKTDILHQARHRRFLLLGDALHIINHQTDLLH